MCLFKLSPSSAADPPGGHPETTKINIIMRKTAIIDAAGGALALAGLALVVGEAPDAGLAAVAALKICGGALLWGACRLLESAHPEWGEEDA